MYKSITFADRYKTRYDLDKKRAKGDPLALFLPL
ncbi:hypothetical protein N783_18005 [Pontibacillus marinus BH030004 = DSM 16465]|uniref:Uncharacterized protein n=1 Tax=Pontibacillus marinus BH030004 = DSM 16465 TaxID=1385511 RepID=A0A0A5FZL6_9BACI|nr:hypothetical protein N783_18005 [Pontibacillus marinus BH030004 = DSM 16465]